VTPPPARPLYFDAGLGVAFGFLHEPERGRARGPGVLICPPFGWDDICSYRPRRDWAEHLAASGRPVLRFDFPGTGDSPGGPRDPGRAEAWTASVAAAAQRLRQLGGVGRIVAIGTGVGGLVALHAASEGAAVDDFVLCAVPARGRNLLREMKAFASLEEAETSVPPAEGTDALPEGAMEAAGFLLTAETLADLEAIDVTKETLPRASERHVLLLKRELIDVDKRLSEHLRAEGAHVRVEPGPGFNLFTEEPQLARPPRGLFRIVDRWLDERPEPADPRHDSRVTQTTDVDGGAVRERPVIVHRDGGQLFGVLAEPATGPRADLCALVLNPGALRRIGSGRMWVEIARRWAAKGVPTLRLDLAGIGDSDGDAERYADVGALYVQELVPQVIEAMDELEEQGLPKRFVLMGLCSGAYWSFHAALRDERVVACYLLNVRALFWDRSLAAVRDARKARWALDGRRWRRLLSGEVPLKELLKIVRATLLSPWTFGKRLLDGRRKRQEIEAAFDRLRRARQRVVLAFGEDEPVQDELERDGYLAEVGGRWPNIGLRKLPGNSHTFRPLRAQRRVHRMIDEELAHELGDSAIREEPAAVPP
jgi:pimeloyl-ACP methyl ester carboxylesterase